MPAVSKPIYLDHAAATPLDPAVLVTMQPWLTEKFYNPSSLYGAAREAGVALEDARHRVAQILGAKKSEIIFTAGGTESVNLAILGCARATALLPADTDTRRQFKVVTSAIEHESVLACVAQLEREGFNGQLVPVGSNGIVSPAAIISAIDDQTVLVSLGYANSEIGTIQPIAKIGQQIATVRADRQRRGVRTPIYFHTDAAQAAGALDLHISRLGVDLMTLNAAKIYGPKQSGCLYVRTGVDLQPVIFGGGQERGLRSGSQSVASAVGLATALEVVQAGRKSENRRLSLLHDRTIQQITEQVSGVVLNGDPVKRLASNLNLSITGIDGESLVLYLDAVGIQASTGSACSTGRTDPSHVLLAIGRSPAEANASLRLTLGKSTTSDELDHLTQSLSGIVSRLRS